MLHTTNNTSTNKMNTTTRPVPSAAFRVVLSGLSDVRTLADSSYVSREDAVRLGGILPPILGLVQDREDRILGARALLAIERAGSSIERTTVLRILARILADEGFRRA